MGDFFSSLPRLLFGCGEPGLEWWVWYVSVVRNEKMG